MYLLIDNDLSNRSKRLFLDKMFTTALALSFLVKLYQNSFVMQKFL